MVLSRLTFLSVLLSVSLALAQTGATEHSDLSRGATLPPTGAALADEATAPAINPAGLSYVGAAQLFYAHERSLARGAIVDGLYLADTFFDVVGLGLTVEWVRNERATSYRKTAWSASVGGAAFSLGLSYNGFASDEPALHGLSSFDLGLASRPSRYFSLGATVRNIDAPGRLSVSLDRQYVLGLGLRPFGERLTLGVDFLFTDATGAGRGRLAYTARAEIVRGLSLSAGASHGFSPTDGLYFQLSATVDTSHLGLTYALSGAPNGLSHLALVRLSEDKYRSPSLGGGKVALFDLAALLKPPRSTVGTLLGAESSDPYLQFLALLNDAATDPTLRAVVLKVDSTDLGLARAQEVRAGLVNLREHGKKVVAVILSAGDAEYLAATAADAIYAVPEATLLVDGFAANALFVGAGMEKLGVQFDVARVGAYKNAPDTYTRSEMSDEQREVLNAILDSDVRAFEGEVGVSRQLPTASLRTAIAEGLKTPRRAKELRLIDDVVTPAQLQTKLGELVPGARFDAHYRPRDTRDPRWGDLKRVAVVPVVGSIVGGKGGGDPLELQRSVGADTVIRAIEAAADDSSVVAIVVRVDSPGGDGLASDLMYRAVLEAKKKKPVVASMGNVAASGGYYASMGADEIFAQPTTITGSIGVFLLKPVAQGLADKLGIKQQTVRRGELANLLDPYAPWTDEQRRSAQAWVDSFYDDFITEVAASRSLKKEDVDAIARGHVWSGEDARRLKLVDTYGGLYDAIESAKRRAGLGAEEEIEVTLVGPASSLLGQLAGQSRLAQVPLHAEPSPLGPALTELGRGLSATGLAQPGLKAAMELEVTIR